jgi:hypothetical protein
MGKVVQGQLDANPVLTELSILFLKLPGQYSECKSDAFIGYV